MGQQTVCGEGDSTAQLFKFGKKKETKLFYSAGQGSEARLTTIRGSSPGLFGVTATGCSVHHRSEAGDGAASSPGGGKYGNV